MAPAVLALSLLLAVQAPDSGRTLVPGESRELAIQAGEAQVWQVEAAPGTALLVTVEQRGIDLAVEGRRAGAPITVDASNGRWGPEVLLLEGTGETRVEVRSREKSASPGRYVLHVEEAPAAGDPRRQAFVLTSRAGQEAYPGTAEASARALATYREAAAAWHPLGEPAWEAEALTCLAVRESEGGDLRSATADFQSALALWRDLGNERREAQTLNWLGMISLRTEKPETTRDTLAGSLALWQRLGEATEAAETRGNLCFLEHQAGSLADAAACYRENLAYFRGLGDRGHEALTLNNLGGVLASQGEPDDALASYEAARALHRDLGNALDEAKALANLGDLRRTLGEWQEALRLYDQALALTDAKALRATVLSNVAFIYNSLGEPQRALGSFEEALKLRREGGDRLGEIVTLNNLGSARRKLGEPDRALALNGQALALATSLGNDGQQAVSRLGLAEDHLDRRDAAAALRELDTALPVLRSTGNRRGETEALQLRGRALALNGQAREALPVLQEALEGRRSLRDRAGEAETLTLLAETEHALGLASEARSHVEAAVARVEELRAAFVSPGLRASFLATRRHAFSVWIDLLMAEGRDREAFAASERAHARSLLDALSARDGGTVPPELAARRASLLRRLSAKADLVSRQSAEKSQTLSRETDSILAEIDAVEAEIRKHDPGRSALVAPPAVSSEEIASGLGSGTLLLEYSLGQDRSFLWAVDGRGVRSFVLPPQEKIEGLARQVYGELSTVESGSPRRGEAAADLGRMLLGPVWKDAAHLHRLVIVPDGALHVLPFAALPVPVASFRPLLESLEVVYVPSAATLAAERQRLRGRQEATRWAAVLADPVYTADDPRLPKRSAAPRLRGGTLGTFERLPATGREADAVAGLAPGGQVWLGLGLAANREALLSGKLRGYRVLHFATHAVADARVPELSGLVLSQVDADGRDRDGFVSLADLYGLDLDADLVVLSGCQTALGKEVRGEGIMGLTRGFQFAGVPRVVASLWRVQDRATAELMTRFYRAMWRDLLPPAAALRAAQRSLRREPLYRNPYFWAGFVLQGDWN